MRTISCIPIKLQEIVRILTFGLFWPNLNFHSENLTHHTVSPHTLSYVW
jgi:hypothetical protein